MFIFSQLLILKSEYRNIFTVTYVYLSYKIYNSKILLIQKISKSYSPYKNIFIQFDEEVHFIRITSIYTDQKFPIKPSLSQFRISTTIFS